MAKTGKSVGVRKAPSRRASHRLRAQNGDSMTLRELRKATGQTQIDVSQSSSISQGDVSRLESRTSFDECQVSTLRRYFEALGGQLEFVARFGNKEIKIVAAE